MQQLSIFLFLVLFNCASALSQTNQAAYKVKQTLPSESILNYVGLPNLSVADKAVFFNLVVDSALRRKGADDVVLALKSAILCDQYDFLASEGKAARLRYHARNIARVSAMCPKVIDAGLEAYGRKDYRRALDCFTLYLERYNTSLFVGRKPEHDSYYNECAFFAVQSAYKNGDKDVASRYMDRALQCSEYAEDATLVHVLLLRDNRRDWQDSLHYVSVLTEAHQKYPSNNSFFSMLVEQYTSPANVSKFKRFMEEEVALDKKSKEKWAMLGELEMREKQWNRAIDAYKKAVVIDSAFVEVIYNIGICYYSKGELSQSAAYLEKCRQLDGERAKVDWAQPLYTIYKELPDEQKARELLPMVK